MAHIVAITRIVAARSKDGVELASGGLPPLLGIEANGFFVKRPLAPYIDPPLPWPGSGAGADTDHALALARTFHRAHAIDWCNRFQAGSPELLDVDALRARVEALQSAGVGDPELGAACTVCEEFAARHLRVGHDETDYDATREPLCHFLADDPASAQYVFQPGDPSDSIPALAEVYCACATTTTTSTSSTTSTTLARGLSWDTEGIFANFPRSGDFLHLITDGALDISVAADADGSFSASVTGGTTHTAIIGGSRDCRLDWGSSGVVSAQYSVVNSGQTVSLAIVLGGAPLATPHDDDGCFSGDLSGVRIVLSGPAIVENGRHAGARFQSVQTFVRTAPAFTILEFPNDVRNGEVRVTPAP